MSSIPAFEPRSAHQPAEARGLRRDDVRLLVATRHDDAISHAHFADLPDLLAPGDVLVVNTSATLPAAVSARRADGTPVELHFATPAPNHDDSRWWVVELRTSGGAQPQTAIAGEELALAGGGELELVAPYAAGRRLWLARLGGAEPVVAYLRRNGHPIRYGYVPSPWPLDAYQTAFALHPGSAEMPSAARPFTPELVTRLVTAGVQFAPLTLHTGVSSPERDEPPFPERYAVPEHTARVVNAAERVIAVGTTVVRALESATGDDGVVRASAGWTGLVVTPERGVRAVDGLITGWHEPQASHLLMLEAIAGPELLARSYAAALAGRYLWHEFGDSHLILP
ncbi:MAG TPA: S-adenosylmethionine:tRNA ribosyltransferase-isomerase [Solirubrobacteraceae bacterium]